MWEGKKGWGRVTSSYSIREKRGCKVSMEKEFMSHLFSVLWSCVQSKANQSSCDRLCGPRRCHPFLRWPVQKLISSQLMRIITVTWEESEKEHHFLEYLHLCYVFSMCLMGFQTRHMRFTWARELLLSNAKSNGWLLCVQYLIHLILGIKWSALTQIFFFFFLTPSLCRPWNMLCSWFIMKY